MDRLEAMSILVAAVEGGSFSAASRRLGVPLPTVSRKVAELEAHLNTRLLVRSTRKLALTDAGVSLARRRWVPEPAVKHWLVRFRPWLCKNAADGRISSTAAGESDGAFC